MNSLRKYEIDKLKQVVLYILNKTQGIAYYDLMKMIFCADRYNLLKWGDMVTSQHYAPLPHGPVPSELYTQIEKMQQGNENFLDGIVRLTDKYTVEALVPSDEDYLSESDKEALDAGIKEVQDMGGYENIEKTLHDAVYNRLKAARKPYSEEDIAESGNASEEQIARIRYEESLSHALL